MSTRYTAYIEDGEITTGKEFLKLCTRAFGIAIDVRDEPLSVPTPTHFESSTYYKEEYEKTLRKLSEINAWTFDEARNQMKEDYKERISHYKKLTEKSIFLRNIYLKIRDEVERWVPPTEEHQELKNFALEQIDMCIPDQADIEKYLRQSQEEFDNSNEAVERYISQTREYYQKRLNRVDESWKVEIQRTNEKNEWMQQFLDSLESMS